MYGRPRAAGPARGRMQRMAPRREARIRLP